MNKIFEQSLLRVKKVTEVVNKEDDKSFLWKVWGVYKELYWPLAWASLQQSFLDRLLVFWRNSIVLRLGTHQPLEFHKWFTVWQDSRTIVRNIGVWDLFIRFQVENKDEALEFEDLYSIFFSCNFIFWEFFLVLNLFYSIWRHGAPLYSIIGFLSSSCFIIRQIQYILFENNLEKIRAKGRAETFIGILRNLSLILIDKYFEKERIFLFLSIVNLLFDIIQWWITIYQRIEISFSDIIFRFRKIWNSEPRSFSVIKPFLNITMINGFNNAVSRWCNNFIATKNRNYFFERNLHINNEEANNSLYFFWNVYHQLLHWFHRDFSTAVLYQQKLGIEDSEKDLMVQMKMYYLVQALEMPLLGTLIYTPGILLNVNQILKKIIGKLPFNTPIALATRDPSPFTIRHFRLNLGGTIVNNAMFPILEIASTWEPWYYKYETLFRSLIDWAPFLLSNDYFFNAIISEVVDFLFHWTWFLLLKHKYSDLLLRENYRKIQNRLFPLTLFTYGVMICFLTQNTGL